jgi:hypothetical protein
VQRPCDLRHRQVLFIPRLAQLAKCLVGDHRRSSSAST